MRGLSCNSTQLSDGLETKVVKRKTYKMKFYWKKGDNLSVELHKSFMGGTIVQNAHGWILSKQL